MPSMKQPGEKDADGTATQRDHRIHRSLAALLVQKLVDCRRELLRRYRLYKIDLESGSSAAFDILLHSKPAECDGW
jgi:hypothetical protein